MIIRDSSVQGSAVLSPDGVFRYRLDRWWAPEATAAGSTRMPFLMLNPSTADADTDDATIVRCMNFARREGANGITVVNLGAFRATQPRDWVAAQDPIGPLNGDHIREVAETAGYVVAAWGASVAAEVHARYWARILRSLGVAMFCLGVTKTGAPRHPLYLRSDAALVPWTG